MNKIIIFGDSTTAEYGDGAFPQQGWAHFLPGYLRQGVEVKNYARGGYALKHFIWSQECLSGKTWEPGYENSLWSTVILPEVSKGDAVIFYWGGINDMLQGGRDSYREKDGGSFVRDWQNTSAESYIRIGEGLGTHEFFTVRSDTSEVTAILRRMIQQVREKNAEAIVVKGTGKYYAVNGQDKSVVSVTRRYAEAVTDAAKACGCEYFDMAAELETEFLQNGYEKTAQMYLLPVSTVERLRWEKGIEKPLPPVDDNVHYNFRGAEIICRKLVDQIKQSDSVLNSMLK